MNMKMIQPLLFSTLTAFSLAAPLVNAEETAAPAESQPAAADTEADQFYGAMQERYRLMQEQMDTIRQTRDPQERQKLLQEHWQTLHEGVGMMGRGFRMGPAMTGGYGMGPGMMGGYGMGPGMMGGGGGMGRQGLPGLSAEQQATIAGIQGETRKKHWELMGQMLAEQARLRGLVEVPAPDAAAISSARTKIGELQRQMYESFVDTRKRMEAVLTKEQLEQLRSHWHRGWQRGY